MNKPNVIQGNLFGEVIEEKPAIVKPKSFVIKDEKWTTVEMFLYYPKLKENPNGDPVAKQGDRSNIMLKRNAMSITGKVDGKDVKFYPKEMMYIHHYQPSVITKTAESLAMQAKLLMRGVAPFEKNVIIESMIFYFSPLQSFTKAQKQMAANNVEIAKTTKPDLIDNLPKLLMDALNGIMFTGDEKVSQANNVKKCYANPPGVYLKVTGL